MKAETKYNDFIGTAAADRGDINDIHTFFKSKNVDVERYRPIGVTFGFSYKDSFEAMIYCVDKNKSTNEKPYIISVYFGESKFSKDDFFNLFKRFSVVVSEKIYEESKVDEKLDFRDLAHSVL